MEQPGDLAALDLAFLAVIVAPDLRAAVAKELGWGGPRQRRNPYRLGGCRILAEAVIAWLDHPEAVVAGLYTVYPSGRAEPPAHLLVVAGGVYLDGGGVQDPAAWQAVWASEGQIDFASHRLEPYQPRPSDDHFLWVAPRLSRRITADLRRAIAPATTRALLGLD